MQSVGMLSVLQNQLVYRSSLLQKWDGCRPVLVRYAKDVKMKRKSIYAITLFAFVVLVGVFGFAAAAPVSAQPRAQETIIPPEVTVIPPDVTAIVPVTGDDDAVPNIMTLLFYGFLGLLAIVLLIALFASANRTTVVREGPPPDDHDHVDHVH